MKYKTQESKNLDKARTKEAQGKRKAEKAREHLTALEAQLAKAKEAEVQQWLAGAAA